MEHRDEEVEDNADYCEKFAFDIWEVQIKSEQTQGSENVYVLMNNTGEDRD